MPSFNNERSASAIASYVRSPRATRPSEVLWVVSGMESRLRVSGDEVVHDVRKLFTFVFLDEVPTADDCGVGLSRGSGNQFLKVAINYSLNEHLNNSYHQ